MDLWNTYYSTPSESDYSGADDTAIYDMSGNIIKMCPAAFVAKLCVEGAGVLSDGRVVNTAGQCSYGPICSPYTYQQCYSVVDGIQFPWGKGSTNNPLVPFRTIATDPSVIPTGSAVILPQFQGLYIPAIGGIGGFTHDGCFMASDVGGAINGNHIDIFVGPDSMAQAMESILPTGTHYDASVGGAACSPVAGAASGPGPVSAAVPLFLIFAGVTGIGWWLIRRGRS
jgi:3D (Asp-Asp-Asp) domain-containing protein